MTFKGSDIFVKWKLSHHWRRNKWRQKLSPCRKSVNCWDFTTYRSDMDFWHNIMQMVICGYCIGNWPITLRPGQNGCHFADDMFKFIFVYENCCIFIQICIKVVPKVPINISDDELVLDRRQAIIWTNDGLFYWKIFASLSLDKLRHWQNGGHFAEDIFKCIWWYDLCQTVSINLNDDLLRNIQQAFH